MSNPLSKSKQICMEFNFAKSLTDHTEILAQTKQYYKHLDAEAIQPGPLWLEAPMAVYSSGTKLIFGNNFLFYIGVCQVSMAWHLCYKIQSTVKHIQF